MARLMQAFPCFSLGVSRVAGCLPAANAYAERMTGLALLGFNSSPAANTSALAASVGPGLRRSDNLRPDST